MAIRQKTCLPGEIMEEILLKLPIKSLLRFKSVCKQWLCLFSDQFFIQSQLKHVLSHQEDHQKTMIVLPLSRRFYILDHDDDDDGGGGGSNTDDTAVLQHNIPFPVPDGVTVLGSCNGLLCLGNHRPSERFGFQFLDYQLFLWNPLLNNYKQLPIAVTLSGWFGFGYDSHTDDYKFVKIFTNPPLDMIWEMKASVYTLKKKKSRWRMLPFENKLVYDCPPYRPISYQRPEHPIGVALNGSIYWLGHDGFSLIAFNLRFEEFSRIELPNRTRVGGRLGPAKLTVVRNSLTIIKSNISSKFFVLMSMKQDTDLKNGISWGRVKIQCRDGIMAGDCLCLMMNGDILMRVGVEKSKNTCFRNQRYDFMSYSPQGLRIKKIGIENADNKYDYMTCLETLVLPSKLL